MSNPTSENPNLADTLLFEQFATLATAPDGIGRLRELILQLAVQGRLGTQDERDEPASALLERNRSRINSCVKKDRTQITNLEDVPFSLPKRWEWTQIGNIALIKGGKRLPNGSSFSDIPTDYVYIRISNMKNGTIEDREIKYIEKSVFEQIKHYIIDKDDIYITIAGTIGDVGEVPERFHGMNLTENAAKIIFKEIDKKYLILAIKSKTTQLQFFDKTNIQAQPKLALKRINDTIIPLPPLAEQHRIVAKVDRLMALCDELEARQQQERAGCLKLGTASFAGLQNAESPEEFGRQWAQVCDAFDLILNCPENVAVLRQTILQLAVQGRLVKQEPGDEPAEKLINIEINDSIQTTDIPFNLPNGWIWVKCVSLCEKDRIITYGVIKLGSHIRDGVPVLRSSDVKWLHIDNFNIKRIDPSIASQYQRTFLKGGEIVINVRGTLGGVAVVPRDIIGYNISREVAVIPIISAVSAKYIAYALASNHCQNCLSKITKGIAYSGINIADLKQLSIPLPPLAEQHRIVAKVDALMALCDQLEAQLKERAGMQGKFTGAVVKSIGTG